MLSQITINKNVFHNVILFYNLKFVVIPLVKSDLPFYSNVFPKTTSVQQTVIYNQSAKIDRY